MKAPITHVVIDPRAANKIMGRYRSVTAARRGRDRLDLKYGAVRYRVQSVKGGAA